jgi:hypothetical protein
MDKREGETGKEKMISIGERQRKIIDKKRG